MGPFPINYCGQRSGVILLEDLSRLFKITKGRKLWKTKVRTKNKGNKQKTVMNIVDINQTVRILTFKVSDLNASIKRDCQSAIEPNYILSTRNPL